ncbi:DoxX family protein [Mesorhizobium sp. LNJC405B00]|uniref:DoxX family protein n=1 Tax=unclassified Mesorhizobium TaxID=325217 RepID=UPI0003CE02FD|nr:DoxX family protein [Mesorhizobium sp. LNJC405B00]ESX99028.1 DoxX family protein [Mesorhizobium sp. LNJC405B00]
MSATTDASRGKLIVPVFGRLYSSLYDGAETQKITNPFGTAEMVEGLGFCPGAFWSLLLSCTEFFGGILIAIGLLTRPAAFAGMIVLLVTVWFHWITVGQGFSGAEKSLLWAAILLFFVIRGGNRQSVDARLGKAF